MKNVLLKKVNLGKGKILSKEMSLKIKGGDRPKVLIKAITVKARGSA